MKQLRDDERYGATLLDLARKTAELAVQELFALRREEVRESLRNFIETTRKALDCEHDPNTGRWYSRLFLHPVVDPKVDA